jgi:hypothetical protein
MSRTPTEYTIPPPPPGLVLNPVTNLRGRAAAVAWIRDKLGIEVSERYLLDATTRREVEHAKIMREIHYSESGLYRWIMSKTRPANERHTA